MEVLIVGAAVLAVMLGAGWWAARAPRGPGSVLGIALDVLSGAFLLQPARARERTRPHRAARERRDVTAPAPAAVDVRAQTPVPAPASVAEPRPEQAAAHH